MSPTNDPQEWIAGKNALNKQKEQFAKFVQHQAEPTVSKEEEINELHRLTDEQNNMKDVENRRT